MNRWLAAIGVAMGVVSVMHSSVMAADPFPVEIRIDAQQTLGPLRPVWRFLFPRGF